MLGVVLFVLTGAQIAPLPWCLHPLDPDAALGLASGAGACAVLGSIFRFMGKDQGELYRRDGVLIVVGAWLLASIAGAIPYLASGAIGAPM